MGDITELLLQLRGGDERARDRLFTMVYAELQSIARQRLRHDGMHTQLDAPSVVHEAYLRLVKRPEFPANDRNMFFAYASTVMRGVIVDYLRSRNAQKRGAGVPAMTLLTSGERELTLEGPGLEALGPALESLARIDERAHRIVEMRYFGGMTIEEVGEVLELSPATVKRDWQKARGFLLQALEQADS